MNRRSLELIAAILITLMVIVATAGLDHLPRQLRESATSANSHLAEDRAAFDRNRTFIDRAIRDEPALFQAKAALWRQRLDRDRARLDASATDLASLQQFAQANRRTDAGKVEKTLGDFESLRKTAIGDESEIRTEAERWLTYKRELPKRLDAMRTSYEAVKTFDIAAATLAVHKAMVDWPAKRDDLQSRIDSLKKLQSNGEQIWDSSATLRSAAEANKLTGSDYATLFSEADHLDAAARELKDSSGTLNTLAGQLYTSWDKLLVDLDQDDGYREKLRIVRTRFPDATQSGGQTTTEEKWETIDAARYRDARRNVGMAVEHKPVGKYDSESEHVPQPPAYAYIAPPGQSNAYGSWTSGVWHWLPEYLILSHLLHGSRGPVTTGDFEAYQSARRRGDIFYGRNQEYRPPGGEYRPRWGGGGIGSVLRPSAPSSSPGSQTSTGWYKERPKPSWGDRGFNGSKYESHGAFSGSRYQSRGTFGARSYSRPSGGFRSFRGGRR
jgi:hypothetical protein